MNPIMSIRHRLRSTSVLFSFIGIFLLVAGGLFALSLPTPVRASNTLTFKPVADSYVSQSQANTNYGGNKSLRVDQSPIVNSYLRFDVDGIAGDTVSKVTLRIYANSRSNAGFTINMVSNNSWQEGQITYNNAPAISNQIGTSKGFSAKTWVTIDVTSLLKTDGSVSLALVGLDSTAINLAARENSRNSPELVVQTTSQTVPTTAVAPTATSTKVSIEPTNPPNPTGNDYQPSFPIRAAFFYPWFPEAWNQQGYDPFTNYHPTLGFYDSGSVSTIQSQIKAMTYANINAAILSWWGQGSSTDKRVATILGATPGSSNPNFRWSVYYENESQGDPSVSQIQSDLSYIQSNYGSNASFLRVNGKFVVFVYADGNDGCGMADRWVQADNALGHPAYIVLKVFSGYRSCASQPDSWHQYSPAVASDEQQGYSYAVSPGFWKKGDSVRLARDLNAWNNDVKSMVASGDPWQLVTTFNEWGEGTSVESAQEWASSSGYGQYLDVLHANGSGTPPPQPTATQPSSPSPTATVTTPPPTPTKTSTTIPTTPPGSNYQPSFPIRAAFFYPWFPEAWNQQGYNPFTNYNPTLGFYNSGSVSTIQSQIKAMTYANINAAILSWWGQGSSTDKRVATILGATPGSSNPNFRWSVYYENESQGDPSVSQIQSDLSYIQSNYGSNASFLRVNGKFVVFVYADGNDGCGMADRWVQADNALGHPAYIVLKVFSGYRSCASQPDSWHQYSPAVASDEQQGYSYAVSPGFWKKGDSVRLARDLNAWNNDVKSMVASGDPWQLVTTFNEWGEGTSVESAQEWASSSGYGQYLDVLHANGSGTPPPQPTATQPSSASPTATAKPSQQPSPTSNPTQPPSSGNDPILFMTSDLVSGSSVDRGAAVVSLIQKLMGQHPGTQMLVASAGDNEQENNPTLSNYQDYFGTTYGVFVNQGIFMQIRGNHDIQSVGSYTDPNGNTHSSGAAYWDYFGANSHGFNINGQMLTDYSYDLGTWHIIGLDELNGNVNSATLSFLKSDLAAHSGSTCQLVYWHVPTYSSGAAHGDSTGSDSIKSGRI